MALVLQKLALVLQKFPDFLSGKISQCRALVSGWARVDFGKTKGKRCEMPYFGPSGFKHLLKALQCNEEKQNKCKNCDAKFGTAKCDVC